MKATASRLAACLFSLTALASLAPAQSFTGNISGAVTDPAGAIVPDAVLTLTNLDTNEVRRQASNETGVYTFAALPPGRYRLELEHAGFKRFVQEPIEVRVQQFLTLNATLEVGQTNQTVEVSGQV